jgi:hypothetical protein
MNSKKIKKQVTFPVELVELVEEKSKRFGLGFNEYIRHVLVVDVQRQDDYPMVDAETERSIGRALKDFENGDYVEVNNKKELKEFLNSMK